MEKQFKKQYQEAKTWKDADDLLNQLTENELSNFIETHEAVDGWTGLDMRQEFYLRTAKIIFKYKFTKED